MVATVKSYTFNEAPRGSFSLPLNVAAGNEFFVTSVVIKNLAAGDRLMLNGTIGWSATLLVPGLSELTVRIRRGTPTGPVLFETRDNILVPANLGSVIGNRTTSFTHADIITNVFPSEETFYLTTRFENLVGLNTVALQGPIHLGGLLTSP
ncbi:hypothetical protein ACFFJY_13010 [Fictibacillus aquaticus]|uniref:Uncharacterized protein n=1 Tax=Fictibacillus aquaticus TaxID=2021314 RepID=A0A235FCP0_9BACL|nr:hypothetical protein [Fictibacillus aquaticus]OYD59150.1 hypothetical protein CGZ90_04430 [Fictibacillus aquaticus]